MVGKTKVCQLHLMHKLFLNGLSLLGTGLLEPGKFTTDLCQTGDTFFFSLRE